SVGFLIAQPDFAPSRTMPRIKWEGGLSFIVAAVWGWRNRFSESDCERGVYLLRSIRSVISMWGRHAAAAQHDATDMANSLCRREPRSPGLWHRGGSHSLGHVSTTPCAAHPRHARPP